MTAIVVRPGRKFAGASVRYLLLTIGAGVMVLPFLYMLSTSFKSQTYVLSLPPQFIPHRRPPAITSMRGPPTTSAGTSSIQSSWRSRRPSCRCCSAR